MNNAQELEARRQEIVCEIASLEQMRRGSVVDQYVEDVLKDGSKVRRGPYPLCSFKEKGKTVSRRLKSRQEVETYRKQIEAFRRFQELSAELVRVCEQLADMEVAGRMGEKKTPKSGSRRTLK